MTTTLKKYQLNAPASYPVEDEFVCTKHIYGMQKTEKSTKVNMCWVNTNEKCFDFVVTDEIMNVFDVWWFDAT